MIEVETAAVDKKRVGLIVIHGIGKQEEPGTTRESVVEGLQFAYPEAEFETKDGVGVIDGLDHDVRVYEVPWAMVLSGEKVWKSFKIEQLQEAVWFPALNRMHQPDYADLYPRPLVVAWTILLVPLGAFLTAAYYGISVLAGTFLETFWPRFNVKPQSGGPGINRFDLFMDEVVGDVFNYVNAAGAAPTPVPEATDAIYAKFREVLARATVTDRCTEIQVLAHSLGTLVAYHALTRYEEETSQLVSLTQLSAGGRPPLSRLYTIGSPLEKIRFFWPKLITSKLRSGESAFRWDNFASRGDPVAGILRRYGDLARVKNHPVPGAGGLITAHTSYRSHPLFLAVFGKGLTGTPTKVTGNQFLGWLRVLKEGLFVNIVIVFSAILGFVFMLGLGYVIGFFLGWQFVKLGDVTGWSVLNTTGVWIKSFFKWFFPTVLVFASIPLGYSRARRLHEHYWRS